MNIGDDRILPRRQRKRAAQCLGWSLQRVDERWAAGRLQVLSPDCAQPRRLPLEALVFGDDTLLLDGQPIPPAPDAVCAVLNKPKHVTSTARDPRGDADLSRYLDAMPHGCFAVGRLDRETTGLLLFTNDGDLANVVLRPDHRTAKTYWLWIDDSVSDQDPRLCQLTGGVAHNGEQLTARDAHIVARSEHATEIVLTLTRGKKRQVRNMCTALGLPLVHLHRSQIGSVTDAGLSLGSWRLLQPTEIEDLWQAGGGRAELRRHQVAALCRLAREARSGGVPDVRLERWLELEPSE